MRLDLCKFLVRSDVTTFASQFTTHGRCHFKPDLSLVMSPENAFDSAVLIRTVQ